MEMENEKNVKAAFLNALFHKLHYKNKVTRGAHFQDSSIL